MRGSAFAVAVVLSFVFSRGSAETYVNEMACHRKLREASVELRTQYRGGAGLSQDRAIFKISEDKKSVLYFQASGDRSCAIPNKTEEGGYTYIEMKVDAFYVRGQTHPTREAGNFLNDVEPASPSALKPGYLDSNCTPGNGRHREVLLRILANAAYGHGTKFQHDLEQAFRQPGFIGLQSLDRYYVAMKFCRDRVPGFEAAFTKTIVEGDDSGRKDLRANPPTLAAFLDKSNQDLDRLADVVRERVSQPGVRCTVACAQRLGPDAN